MRNHWRNPYTKVTELNGIEYKALRYTKHNSVDMCDFCNAKRKTYTNDMYFHTEFGTHYIEPGHIVVEFPDKIFVPLTDAAFKSVFGISYDNIPIKQEKL